MPIEAKRCQWVVRSSPTKSHRCYDAAAMVVEGQRYCRQHAKAAVRTFIAPGTERDEAIAAIDATSRRRSPDPDGLTPMERAIVDVLEVAERPLSHLEIYARATNTSLEFASTARTHIRNLRNKGYEIISRDRGGYWLASRQGSQLSILDHQYAEMQRAGAVA